MPRRKLAFEQGMFCHVVNRGVDREPIFFGDRDYSFFLQSLDRFVAGPGIRLVAYCLMPNHFHLLLKLDQDLLSRTLQRLTMSYSLATNLRRRRTGPLFTGRFRAVRVKADDQLAYASAYIHLNPLRAGLSPSPQNWPFSSYRTYVSGTSSVRLDPEPVLSLFREQGPLASRARSARQPYREYDEDLAPGALKLREPS